MMRMFGDSLESAEFMSSNSSRTPSQLMAIMFECMSRRWWWRRWRCSGERVQEKQTINKQINKPNHKRMVTGWQEKRGVEVLECWSGSVFIWQQWGSEEVMKSSADAAAISARHHRTMQQQGEEGTSCELSATGAAASVAKARRRSRSSQETGDHSPQYSQWNSVFSQWTVRQSQSGHCTRRTAHSADQTTHWEKERVAVGPTTHTHTLAARSFTSQWNPLSGSLHDVNTANRHLKAAHSAALSSVEKPSGWCCPLTAKL